MEMAVDTPGKTRYIGPEVLKIFIRRSYPWAWVCSVNVVETFINVQSEFTVGDGLVKCRLHSTSFWE